MYEKTLIQTGLSQDQALIYETLLKNGPLSASKITKKTPLKRGLVYKILVQLVSLGLVEKKEEPGRIAIFSPAHPAKLKDLIRTQAQKTKDAELVLDGILPNLSSDFNLISGKPNVRFYEGIEGIKEVLKDTLFHNQSKKLLTFSDVAGYATYLKEWNTNYYAPQRKRLGIFEKVIIPNNANALDYMKGYIASEYTKILFIDHKLYPFATEINIYDNKVSYVTFSEKIHIGVIVENEEIYKTMVSIFNFTWELGKKYCQDIQPEWLKE